MRTARGAGLILAGLLLLIEGVLAEDLIRFRGGRIVTGKILSETPEEVTIELDGGGRLTVPRDLIIEVVRDARPDGAVERGAVEGVLRAEVFFLWSGRRRLGTRTFLVRRLVGGDLQLEEEHRFLDEEGREDVRIHTVERVSAAFEPREITHREASSGGTYLVRGEVRDGQIHLAVSQPGERRKLSLGLPDGVRFPLAARELAIRDRERLGEGLTVPVFDARAENFFKYRFESLGKRTVAWEGAATEILVLLRRRGERMAEEIWLDGKGEALTEELNGPELVAVRSTRSRVEAFLSGTAVRASEEEERVRPEFVHPEAGFRVKKPSVAWTFLAQPPGSRKVLSLSDLRFFAYVDVFVLPDAPEGGLLSSLAVTMEQRLRDSSEDFEKLGEGFTEVDGIRAFEFVASSRNKGEELRSLLVGFLKDGKSWLIAMACPAKYFEKALPEFRAILAEFRFLD